jgi:hypothetical protein
VKNENRWESIREDENANQWEPDGWEWIREDENANQWEPDGWEWIREDENGRIVIGSNLNKKKWFNIRDLYLPLK